MIKALVFDFDGLILDTESSLIAAYEAVHVEHGISFDKDIFRRNVGHADYHFDPWSAFNKKISIEILEKERRAKNKAIELKLEVLPGVVDLLDEGVKQGLSLAIASNSSHFHVEGHLGRLGLLKYFNFIACREDVKQPKPEPDMYSLVINNLGIKSNQAIAFEDSHTGSKAARRANLWVVGVPNSATAHHDFSYTHKIIPSLASVTLDGLKATFIQGSSK